MKFPRLLVRIEVFGNRVQVFRNTSKRLFGKRLVSAGVRQLWVGPVFIILQ